MAPRATTLRGAAPRQTASRRTASRRTAPRHRPRAIRAALTVSCLVLSTAACGSGAEAGRDNGGGDTAGGSGSGVLFPDDFKTVCGGAPQSRATSYDPAAAGHKALYFGTYGDSLLDQSSTVLPADWTVTFDPDGDALAAVDLVVCAERTAATEARMCEGYEDDGVPTGNRVRLHHATWQLSVRDAVTGEVIDEQTMKTRANVCPMITSFDGTDQTKDEYARIPDERIAAFLRPHMEPAP
ncbi:hypothetical protein [Nocardioides sp.]|uniref:hypothetical protein n=1 Tax=Nocardioides sp. TaxID=35761 RepID=UPI0027342BE5|nr:hypothetical protein [Nocardioides sp.]MDP3892004.1 hypothetical protein [Nocardioides sp.]